MNKQKANMNHHSSIGSTESSKTALGVTLDEVIESSSTKKYSAPEKYFGVVSTELAYDKDQKVFFIHHPFDEEYLIPIVKSLVSINPNDAGKEVLISFDHGMLSFPVITGKVQTLSHEPNDIEVSMSSATDFGLSLDKKDKLVFKAEKEIVLECGKSSITLTKAGKVLIKGAYVLSRSTGANRIKGGSVQLN